MAEKKGKGRKKLEMKKIENESNRQVTFSKRRSGLFKKAGELCTFTGAEIAMIVFAPIGKNVYSFGHPGVETLIDRFLSPNEPQQPDSTSKFKMNAAIQKRSNQLLKARQNATTQELYNESDQVMEQLEIEKKRGKELDQMRDAGREQFPWQKPIDELDASQLQQFKTSLEHLKENVTKEIDTILTQNSHPRHQFSGSSSNQPMLPNTSINQTFNPNTSIYDLIFGEAINLPFEAD
ncbi:agamous-like MADS-box protein AGL62 [Euphorbia lathyris]|uniref:agamous-like MADS-box protein AGL62 n=1 Tax=Euphorbia lathyris TaxID=212925 RepID=UPI0033143EB7